MKYVYYKISIIVCVLLCSVVAYAQNNLGVATGNWSTATSIYLNPANIADCREKFTIELGAINAGVDNNRGSINSNGGIIGAISNGKTNNMFAYSNNSQFSLIAPYARITGPGFMISINNKHSIAFTTGIRGMNQFNNFDKSLYETISNPSYAANGNVTLTSSKFNYTANLWSEAGLSYGGVLLDQDHSELRVGVTLRYLGGIGYVGLKGNNLNVKYSSGSDTFFAATNSDIEYASNVLSTRSALTNGFTNNSILSQFFGGKDGSGIGADIGVVYDYIANPEREKYDMDGRTGITDNSKNRYTLRLSASVVDMGSILYNGNDNSNAQVSGNGTLTGSGLKNNIQNFTDFKSYIVAQGFSADTTHRNTRVYMPTRMLLSADYAIYKQWYVNATFIANVVNRENFGNSYYNQFTIIPRFDTRWLSVGLPITYSALTKGLKAGIGIRAAGFFVGSDDMLALLANHQYGFNFYIGGNIPFYKIRPKDDDGDHVSNRRDRCPRLQGTWENHGCPVEDKGKTADKADATEN